ncbi:MAG: NAD(P)/FAD-dependent oxidoreductase, partial [Gammaproteobacteria bacterium]
MPIQTDALIIGAGPCGLFQVFELGLLGIKADVVDSLPIVGGQCAELYPDKPIYDIPAIPVCSGEELVANLMKQIEPFDAGMYLGQEVTEVKQQDGYFEIKTSADNIFHAKTVFIAGGVGSFQPRKLRVDGIDALDGSAVHYRVRDPGVFSGKRLVVLGGGDSALDWALELWKSATQLTLIHRRDEYRAAPASVNALKKLASAGQVDVIDCANVVGFKSDGTRLVSVEVGPKEGEPRTLEADHLLIFFGLSPKLGPIAGWGLDINRKAINVDTA